jgi:hypothetical protein
MATTIEIVPRFIIDECDESTELQRMAPYDDDDEFDDGYHPTPEESKIYSREQVARDGRGATLPGFGWHGEQRPKGARRVEPRSHFPQWKYMLMMVRDLGYSMRSARSCQPQWDQIIEYAKVAQAHHLRVEQFRGSRPGQRRAGVGLNGDDNDRGNRYVNDPKHDVDVAVRRTTVGGGFTQKQVSTALRNFRFAPAMSLGVFDVVYLRRAPRKVSIDREIGYSALTHNCTKVRRQLRTFKDITPLESVNRCTTCHKVEEISS